MQAAVSAGRRECVEPIAMHAVFPYALRMLPSSSGVLQRSHLLLWAGYLGSLASTMGAGRQVMPKQPCYRAAECTLCGVSQPRALRASLLQGAAMLKLLLEAYW